MVADRIRDRCRWRLERFEAVFGIKSVAAVIGEHLALAADEHDAVTGDGFSGHGLQQSPAMGRGVCELVLDGEYRSLDLAALGYERILRNEPLLERAVI